MSEPARHLQVVDTETGELVESCPGCAEKQDKIDGLSRKLAAASGQITKLQRDRRHAMREHQLFGVVNECFGYWQERTDHPKSELTTERFDLTEAILRHYGAEDGQRRIHLAVDALARSDWHMKRGEHADRKGPKQDRYDTLLSPRDRFEQWVSEGEAHLAARVTGRRDFLATPLPASEVNMALYAPDGATAWT